MFLEKKQPYAAAEDLPEHACQELIFILAHVISAFLHFFGYNIVFVVSFKAKSDVQGFLVTKKEEEPQQCISSKLQVT